MDMCVKKLFFDPKNDPSFSRAYTQVGEKKKFKAHIFSLLRRGANALKTSFHFSDAGNGVFPPRFCVTQCPPCRAPLVA